MMSTLRSRNLIFGVIIALVFLGFGLDRLGYLAGPRLFLQTIIQPAQTVVSGAASQASAITQERQSLEELQANNLFLQSEVNRLLIENIALKELEGENKRLRELLNYTQNNPGFDYTAVTVAGRVIGADPSNFLYTIFVDAGAKQGIARGMPVVTHRGLVGRVVQVAPNSAQILLLIDPTSSVNAVVQNSRVEGVVKGELGGTLLMERIPQGEQVTPGDLVLTSGLGGKFPDKLVIGQITEVFQQDLALFQTARIRPTIDFGDLETVLIITAFEPVEFERELLSPQEVGN